MSSNKQVRSKQVLPETTPTGQKISYQQQFRTCGKKRCLPCRNGQGHGPYWYAFWHVGTQPRSCYLGRTCDPARLLQQFQQAKQHTSPNGG